MEPAARLSRAEPEDTSTTFVSSGSDSLSEGKNDVAGAGERSDLNSRKGPEDGASVHSKQELSSSRLEARVFELENRLRETEEELQFYFEFFKKAKKAEAGGSGGVREQQQPSKNSDDLSDDSDLDDEVPSSNHYTGNTHTNG